MTTIASMPKPKVTDSGNTPSLRTVLQVTRVILTYAVLIGFALLMILPFIYSVANSFKTLPDINASPQSLIANPELGWTTAGYQKIITANNPGFGRALFNSALVAFFVTIGKIVLDSMAGYALARIKFRGRGIVFALLIGTLMIPGIVLLIPRYLVMKQLGLLDSYWGLILPNIADAFGIFLMKQFFESIPGEIEEAAEIDGCSRIRMFFTIVLPMAVPAITALAIFSFQGSWNDFTGPLIALSRRADLYTLPLALALLKGVTGTGLQWDVLIPGAVITTLPMAIVFFLFQRLFVEGTSYSGVKG